VGTGDRLAYFVRLQSTPGIETLVLNVDRQIFVNGEELEATLAEFSARRRTTDSEVIFTPIVNMTNHGTVEVYGDENDVLFPRHSTNSSMQRVIRNYEEAADRREGIEKDGELIILRRD